MAEITQPAALPNAAPAPTRQRYLGLRVVLIIAAVLEAFDALSSVPTLFGDMSEIPGSGLGISPRICRWRRRRWRSPQPGACAMPSLRSAPWPR
jgi:hypothetical protein